MLKCEWSGAAAAAVAVVSVGRSGALAFGSGVLGRSVGAAVLLLLVP